MGTNKETRKKMRAELKVIREHVVKIDLELQKPEPDRNRIAKWQKDIRIHERRFEVLQKRLPGRSRK